MNLFKLNKPLREKNASVTTPERKASHVPHNQGNILFAILSAIALMGALSFAITQGLSGTTKNISDSEMKAHAESILRYAKSVKDAVHFMYTTKNINDTDFLFAHPKNHTDYGDDLTVNANRQVFSPEGGGAAFMWPIPDGINDGTAWEVFSNSDAPGVGTSASSGTPDSSEVDLILVLPNVTEDFCRAVNQTAGYQKSDAIPQEEGTCDLYNTSYRWDGNYPHTSASGNLMDSGSEGYLNYPATYLCVECEDNAGEYHFYYTLLAR